MQNAEATDSVADAKAVDDYLETQFGLGLEEVLCNGCLMSRLDERLGASARILIRQRQVEREDDGGEFGLYRGVLILGGVWYEFACHIFVDDSGQSFLADLGQFAAIEWKLRVAV
jgi:hypothetical protein